MKKKKGKSIGELQAKIEQTERQRDRALHLLDKYKHIVKQQEMLIFHLRKNFFNKIYYGWKMEIIHKYKRLREWLKNLSTRS